MIRALAQQARAETRIPALFLQGRGKDGTWLRAVRHRIRRHYGGTIFSLPRIQTEKTKRSPALSSQSRAGRAPRAAGAPLLWIAWRMVRRKAQRVERGEKTKRTKKVWGSAANCSIFSFKIVFFLLFFCAFLFPRPLSSANLGDVLASTLYSTSEMEEETKRTKKMWQRCSKL